jgi:hypothetical protein
MNHNDDPRTPLHTTHQPSNADKPFHITQNAKAISLSFIRSCPPLFIQSIEKGRQAALEEKFLRFDTALLLYQECCNGLENTKSHVEKDPTIRLIITRKIVEYSKKIIELQLKNTEKRKMWEDLRESEILMLDEEDSSYTHTENHDGHASNQFPNELEPRNAAYSDQNTLFHNIFPEVPAREILIRVFSCGVGDSFKTVRVSRVFLTRNYMCCYSHRSRMSSVIKLHTITNLIKIFPLGIQIQTSNGDIYLRCILRRNLSFEILEKMWQSSKALFGVPLIELVARENNPSLIPSIVEQTVNALSTNSRLKAEGIFRVSPTSTELNNVKLALQQGETVDFQQMNPHLTACALKLFLRSLPEPLLSYRLYQSFIDIFDIPELPGQINQIKFLLKKLPVANQNLVHYLLDFLQLVVLNSNDNKMNLNSICIIFGPLFLQSSDSDFDVILSENLVVQELLAMMITNFAHIFDGRPSRSRSV